VSRDKFVIVAMHWLRERSDGTGRPSRQAMSPLLVGSMASAVTTVHNPDPILTTSVQNVRTIHDGSNVGLDH
jgi:hypothetical protein